MVKPQGLAFLPEHMRGGLSFTDEEKEASTYYPLFEVPFWTSQMEDRKAISEVLPHFKKSQSADVIGGASTKEDQQSFPGGRSWNIVDSRTRLSTPQSNGNNITDDSFCKQFLETLQKECSRILQHSPEKHTIHHDHIAISGAYVNYLPAGCCLEQNIAPNNELIGLLILETPPMTGELYFQDPAWITKSMSSHNISGSTFPSPEVTQHFSFDESQLFLFPSWMPMSMTNHRKINDPENTGIWFMTLRISIRSRPLNPAVVISDAQEESEYIYKQLLEERNEYKEKLEALGELN
tara:strand:+ start:498 stop:1379 length:882 start_codon:yes stop_codon:yes gene_type:complete